jgi:hypothetical protein
MDGEIQFGLVMKKYAIDFFGLIVFWSIIYYGLRFLFVKLGIATSFSFYGVIFTLFCVSFLYKKCWSLETFKNRRKIFIFGFSVIFFFVASTYTISLHKRSIELYNYITAEKKRGWKGLLHQADDILGYIPIPNAKGFQTFPVGDDKPMAYDKNGFRIPSADTNQTNFKSNFDILFLGCSITYGDACLAEETFPYLVAEGTKLSYANAGVCGYGLTQMLILAERLIPKYKPKYVIVQYSRHLIIRGTSLFAPFYFGHLPNPYLRENGDSFEIVAPLFKTKIFDLDFETIKAKSLRSSYFNTIIPFILKDDWLALNSKIKLGILKKPTSNYSKAELFSYSRIIDIAKANNSNVIILNLYNNLDHNNNINLPFSFKELKSQPGVFLVNVDSLLYDNLKRGNLIDFGKAYYHFYIDGTDTIFVDRHPNALAHKIISQSIIKTINKN